MVEKGQKVSVSYVGRFEDGTIFDKSDDHDGTLDFVVGAGGIIAGFDNAVRDMEVGETTTVTIPPAEAYGEYKEELVDEVPLEQLPNGEEFVKYVGQTVYLEHEGGTSEVQIKKVEDGKITFDFNHPMAGRTLIFDITLVSIDAEASRPGERA